MQRVQVVLVWKFCELIRNVESMALLFRFFHDVSLLVGNGPDLRIDFHLLSDRLKADLHETAVAKICNFKTILFLYCNECSRTADSLHSTVRLPYDLNGVFNLVVREKISEVVG